MKTFKIKAKFLILTLAVLPLSFCSKDEENENTDEVIASNAESVILTSARSMSPHNTVKGIKGLRGERYLNTNLTLGFTSGYNVSFVFGNFGATDADAVLEIYMEVARKRTIDANTRDFGAITGYGRAYAFNLLDAVMVNTNYNLTKKGGGTLFITKDKQYKTDKYPFRDYFDSNFAFSTAGLFTSNANSLYDDIRDVLNADVYYSEDEVFLEGELTDIPTYQFVDFRMLLHLRFLVRNGATDTKLSGINTSGEVITFTLNANSDLLALSDEFEENEIETIIFSTKGDYRIDYFNGYIFGSEIPESGIREIEYKKGKPIFEE